MDQEKNQILELQENELQKKKKAWLKKHWPIVLVIVILLLVGFMVFSRIFSEQDKNSSSENVFQDNNIELLSQLLPNKEDILKVAIGDIENEIDEDRYYYHTGQPRVDDLYINYSLFDISLDTGELSPDKYFQDEITNYSGIPFVDNEEYSTVGIAGLTSQNKKERLVWIGTKNHDEPVDGTYGGYYINEEAPLTYKCEVSSKTCEQISTIPVNPRAVTEPDKNNSDRFYDGPSRYWLKWNNETDRLLGHYHGEGGPGAPVYVLDINSKEIYTVCDDKKGCPGFGFTNWDNSTERVFVVNYKFGESEIFKSEYGERSQRRRHTFGQIFKYDAEKNNYVWEKEFDLSSIDSQPYASVDNKRDYLKYAKFSKDPNYILLFTSRNMYSLNIDSGEITHLIDVTPAIEVQEQYGRTSSKLTREVKFSPSGRYVYFVGKKEQEADKGTLYTIDLLNNFEVKPVVSADYIDIR